MTLRFEGSGALVLGAAFGIAACGQSASSAHDPPTGSAGSAGIATGGAGGAGGAGGGAGSGGAGVAGNGGSDRGGSGGAAGRAAAGDGGTGGGDAGSPARGGTAGTGGGAAGAAGRRAMLPTPCDDPTEVVPGGGLVRCDNGLVHRPTAGVCPAYVPSTETLPPSTLPDQDECFTDAECTAKPLGFCERGFVRYGATVQPNRCHYACTEDTDCDDGSICLCTEERGTCSGPSGCVTDADCEDGAFCAPYAPQCAEPTEFSCQTPSDECALQSDCPSGLVCGSFDGMTRKCSLPPCAS